MLKTIPSLLPRTVFTSIYGGTSGRQNPISSLSRFTHRRTNSHEYAATVKLILNLCLYYHSESLCHCILVACCRRWLLTAGANAAAAADLYPV